jgi:putative redox protein
MIAAMRPVTVRTAEGKFKQRVQIGPHTLIADEPPEGYGGTDTGPAPHEWLLAGLGACTSMTLKLYADRKQWPLEAVEVAVEGDPTAEAFVFKRKIRLVGALDEEQRERLLEIANKCPVHKTLSGTIRIESELVT